MNRECRKVIIIDDDACNNLIFKMTLTTLCKPALPDIADFIDPAEGVAYIENIFACCGEQAVLFLDINMPELDGWDVLERLNLLPDYVKHRLTVYMLSSSLDITDKQRATNHPLVKEYIEKPLTTAMAWLKEELLSEAVVCA